MGADPPSTALFVVREVANRIEKASESFQEGLKSAAESLSAGALKEMRRFLPASGQRFDWTSLDNHRMVSNLRATASTAAGSVGAAGESMSAK